MIMTATEVNRGKWEAFCLLCVSLDMGEENSGMRQVCVSEGPSLLCARVHGEGGGLWRGLAAAVFSIQTLPTHWTRVMLWTKWRQHKLWEVFSLVSHFLVLINSYSSPIFHDAVVILWLWMQWCFYLDSQIHVSQTICCWFKLMWQLYSVRHSLNTSFHNPKITVVITRELNHVFQVPVSSWREHIIYRETFPAGWS